MPRAATMQPVLARGARRSPLIVAERGADHRFQFTVRSVLNIALMTCGPFDTEGQMWASIDVFVRRCGDENGYFITQADSGFVITLISEEGHELGRTRTLATLPLARANVRLIAQQARQARVVGP